MLPSMKRLDLHLLKAAFKPGGSDDAAQFSLILLFTASQALFRKLQYQHIVLAGK
jgi:hypothetical protein